MIITMHGGDREGGVGDTVMAYLYVYFYPWIQPMSDVSRDLAREGHPCSCRHDTEELIRLVRLRHSGNGYPVKRMLVQASNVCDAKTRLQNMISV